MFKIPKKVYNLAVVTQNNFLFFYIKLKNHWIIETITVFFETITNFFEVFFQLKIFIIDFYKTILVLCWVILQVLILPNLVNIDLKFIIIFTVWWLLLLSAISYFKTIYTFSKWTSQIKFFWLRLFSIFWGLEIYLLGIFLFLFIISPDDLKYFFFVTKTIFLITPNLLTIDSYIAIFLLLITVNLVAYTTVYRAQILNEVLYLFIFFGLLKLLSAEVLMYINYTSFINYQTKTQTIFKEKIKLLDQNTPEFKIVTVFCETNNLKIDEILKHRPMNVILNLILIVKFFHLYLIIGFITILLLINIFTKTKVSLEVCATITQNLIILLLFYILNYLIFYKFLYKYIMYGFYDNITLNQKVTQQPLKTDEYLNII